MGSGIPPANTLSGRQREVVLQPRWGGVPGTERPQTPARQRVKPTRGGNADRRGPWQGELRSTTPRTCTNGRQTIGRIAVVAVVTDRVADEVTDARLVVVGALTVWRGDEDPPPHPTTTSETVQMENSRHDTETRDWRHRKVPDRPRTGGRCSARTTEHTLSPSAQDDGETVRSA